MPKSISLAALLHGLAMYGMCGPALSAEASLEVASSVDGAKIRQGEALEIRWRTLGAPQGSSGTFEMLASAVAKP
jgi:hypothetical protein